MGMYVHMYVEIGTYIPGIPASILLLCWVGSGSQKWATEGRGRIERRTVNIQK